MESQFIYKPVSYEKRTCISFLSHQIFRPWRVKFLINRFLLKKKQSIYLFFPLFSLSLQVYIFSFAPKSFPCFRCCFPFNLHRFVKREMKISTTTTTDERMPEDLKLRHRLCRTIKWETESRRHDSLYVSPSVTCTKIRFKFKKFILFLNVSLFYTLHNQEDDTHIQ